MAVNKFKILHPLGQRPDFTGGGIYLLAILREAEKNGHENFLIAGIPGNDNPVLQNISQKNCSFVRFVHIDLPFPVVGMSDVMPYSSSRFCDLTLMFHKLNR